MFTVSLQRTQQSVQVGLSVSSQSYSSIHHLNHESIKTISFKDAQFAPTEAALSDSFYLLCHTYSSCFSFILITAQLGKTQQAIVSAARRHDDGGSVPLSWPSVNSATAPQNTLILKEVITDGFWSHFLFTVGPVYVKLQPEAPWKGTQTLLSLDSGQFRRLHPTHKAHAS